VFSEFIVSVSTFNTMIYIYIYIYIYRKSLPHVGKV